MTANASVTRDNAKQPNPTRFINYCLVIAHKKARRKTPGFCQSIVADYSRLPRNLSKNRNRFTKSRYKLSAPIIAPLATASPVAIM